MEKYEDGVVGPRTLETLDQMFCMKGMTSSEKIDFLMSRNRELRAENHRLRVELTDLHLRSCPSCGVKVENEKLRDLVMDMWNDMCVCHDQHIHPSSRDLRFHADNMRKLGIEVDE